MRRRLLLLLVTGLAPGCFVPRQTPGGSIDGLYVTVGPTFGGARIENEWLSVVGLEGSLVRVREHRALAGAGFAAGGATYAGREGGRVWLEAEAAYQGPLPVAVGLGAGPIAEVEGGVPVRAGAAATFWIFAGFVPYVRAGYIQDAGSFYEAGLMLKLPVARFFPR